MRYAVDPTLDVPPSRQLIQAVLDAVATGAITPGDRLPSVRGLAAEALVNPNTVAKAYRSLQEMGVLKGMNGRGVFVADEGPTIARKRRRSATLTAFTRAAEEALRAGHAPENLIRDIRSRGEK
jgi:DNA-binding transcriptional regulator YhcF (GntR family)